MGLSFAFFNATLSQQGHSMSIMTIMFALLANHEGRYFKLKMCPQLGDCHFSLPQLRGVCGYLWVSMLSFVTLPLESSSIGDSQVEWTDHLCVGRQLN